MRRNRRPFASSIGAVLVVGWVSVGARSGSLPEGAITGIVGDINVNEPFPGADIEVKPEVGGGPAIKTVSGFDGRYRVANLPSGNYSVRFSFGVDFGAVLCRHVGVSAGHETVMSTMLTILNAPEPFAGTVLDARELERKANSLSEPQVCLGEGDIPIDITLKGGDFTRLTTVAVIETKRLSSFGRTFASAVMWHAFDPGTWARSADSVQLRSNPDAIFEPLRALPADASSRPGSRWRAGTVLAPPTVGPGDRPTFSVLLEDRPVRKGDGTEIGRAFFWNDMMKQLKKFSASAGDAVITVPRLFQGR
jgi:hypothetical protein